MRVWALGFVGLVLVGGVAVWMSKRGPAVVDGPVMGQTMPYTGGRTDDRWFRVPGPGEKMAGLGEGWIARWREQNPSGSPKPYVWKSRKASDATRPGEVSIADAVCAAREFLEKTGLPIPDTIPIASRFDWGVLPAKADVRWNGFYSVSVNLHDGSIASFDNQIREMGIAHRIGRTGKKRFSDLNDAKAYLNRLAMKLGLPAGARLVRTDPAVFDAKNVGGNDRGEIWATFGLTYKGLAVPANCMVLTLDAQDGTLKRFTATWRRYIVETSEPRLTASEAREAAEPVATKAKLGQVRCICTEGQPKPKPPRLFFTVRRSADGHALGKPGEPVRIRLAWNVNYGYDAVIVDAVTGEILDTSEVS